MNRLLLGTLLGLTLGGLACALMARMQFPDKRRALLGAFASRFLIGFFIGATQLPLPPVAAGAAIGFAISVPDAIITRALAPVLITGTVFGAIGGAVMGAYGI